VLWHCWLGSRKGIRPVENGGWWRWALVGPDGVAPSQMVSVSASINLPLHYEVQVLFWHRLTRVVPEKSHKTVVCVCVFVCWYSFLIQLTVGGWVGLDGGLHIQIVYQQMVTNLSINQAQCRVVMFTCTMPVLPLRHSQTTHWAAFSLCWRRSLLKCSSQRPDWYNNIKHTKHIQWLKLKWQLQYNKIKTHTMIKT